MPKRMITLSVIYLDVQLRAVCLSPRENSGKWESGGVLRKEEGIRFVGTAGGAFVYIII